MEDLSYLSYTSSGLVQGHWCTSELSGEIFPLYSALEYVTCQTVKYQQPHPLLSSAHLRNLSNM